MLLIRNGHVLDPKTGLDGVYDILTDGDTILKIGKELEAPEAEVLMDALSGLNLLSKTELETEDGIIPAYLLSDEEALVPFLYLARWMTTGGGGFLNGPYRKSPMLRGEKWKETEEN